jgi:PST family polysaccharide transporter
VAWLLPAVSLAALLGAPTGLAQARLSHSMDFRRVARIEAGASAVSAIAGVAAAWAGWGLWSLVVYATVQRVLELWAFLRVPGALPRVRPSRREAPALLRWTMPLVGVQVLTFASGSVDQVLVGRAADPTSLGLYSFGRRLTQQPTQMMTFAISRALFPALIHAADGAAGQGTLALRAMRLSVLAASGILFLLAAVAPDFVVVALGEEWRPAAPYVALFAAASAVLPIGAVFDATLRANGRTARQLLYQVLRFAVLVVVLSVMAAQGAGAWSMAVAVAVIGLIELLPGSIESAHALREPYRRIVAALVLGALPAALMYLALAALGRWAFDDLSSAARLALGLALGPVLWTALSWPTLRRLRRRPGAGLP